ncbi:MAG: LysR family transcriptional regulator [Sphingomonadales bacterium]|jgi:DNA-binding transcriptional LysR family regulator|nr:LysR family transcriptional regulator [Sphingomonadales bacterium]
MEVGTVRAAAKLLGVHHSTVSLRIEQLEKSLDS